MGEKQCIGVGERYPQSDTLVELKRSALTYISILIRQENSNNATHDHKCLMPLQQQPEALLLFRLHSKMSFCRRHPASFFLWRAAREQKRETKVFVAPTEADRRRAKKEKKGHYFCVAVTRRRAFTMAAPEQATTTDRQQPPEGWARCHFYLERKNRFCRQQVVKDTCYCGNHQPPTEQRKRVPCPIDPSHLIYSDQVEKHSKVCPFHKKRCSQQEQSYYRHNVNTGGHGLNESSDAKTPSNNVPRAHGLARKILQAHQRVFNGVELSETNVCDLSLQNVVDAIPSLDLAREEMENGLKDSVEQYRIKSGGSRHLTQQGSLVGHLRRIKVFDNHDNDNLTILEMGAGRGMFGLMAAGVAAKTCSKVQLVLVERSGTRSKADSVLRMAKDETDYMALNRVHFSRIQCDLSHVHMPTVVMEVATSQTDCSEETAGSKRKHPNNKKKKTVAIAKHLCGAGTDLALKSLKDVQVDACVMASCCHGVCSWDHYVGRDFLKSILGDDFGVEDFDRMRRWSSGTVSDQCASCIVDGKDAGDNEDDDDEEAPEHGKFVVDDRKDPTSVVSIIQHLGLASLGPQGLGRACQRLLDQGRLEYMRQVLGHDEVEMFHYVPSSVTPQNAVLISYRN